jgi:hypothetical protein
MENELNITTAKYIAKDGINSCIEIVVNEKTMSVPIDTSNRHYAEILRQVEEGTLTIAEAD